MTTTTTVQARKTLPTWNCRPLVAPDPLLYFETSTRIPFRTFPRIVPAIVTQPAHTQGEAQLQNLPLTSVLLFLCVSHMLPLSRFARPQMFSL